jgi:hypothetical protein
MADRIGRSDGWARAALRAGIALRSEFNKAEFNQIVRFEPKSAMRRLNPGDSA